MSFSSRRRNYLLTPHRRDGLIEWMKEMLTHSFVLDALDSTGADTFSHFEMLIEEHRTILLQTSQTSFDINGNSISMQKPSRLRVLVPTVGTFHTRLPLRRAFLAYNAKYAITTRRHVCISFNEIRHILNLAQIMAFLEGKNMYFSKNDTLTLQKKNNDDDDEAAKRWSSVDDSPSLFFTKNAALDVPPLDLDGSHEKKSNEESENLQKEITASISLNLKNFKGPKLISFDGDQTLYSDGANFESNPKLATYLYLLLRHGVTVAVVTAAGYEYQSAKYELRLSGLLTFFKEKGLTKEDCERFYLFGGECNYLLNLGPDFKLHAVKEYGPGGWITSTKFISEAPANWKAQHSKHLLDIAETCFQKSVKDQKLHARIIRKKRSVGLVPEYEEQIPREALDETVLRVQDELEKSDNVTLPFCAFNGGSDVWVDVGNKRVGVEILQSYLGIDPMETLHIGDQFLNTGNDYAARDVCPCVWITSPTETTYILKSILRLAGVSLSYGSNEEGMEIIPEGEDMSEEKGMKVNFDEIERRTTAVQLMDVYTGEMRTVKK